MLLAQGLPAGSGPAVGSGHTFASAGAGADIDRDVHAIPTHPLGIKPLGNQYLASGPTARQSLGPLAILPDELILHLAEYFDARSLRGLASTCRFLFGFGQLDDLWKSLFLE